MVFEWSSWKVVSCVFLPLPATTTSPTIYHMAYSSQEPGICSVPYAHTTGMTTGNGGSICACICVASRAKGAACAL